MAVESEYVTSDVVEISEFPDLARLYGVTGVPKIVINDEMELLGAQSESTLISAIKELGDGNQAQPSQEG